MMFRERMHVACWSKMKRSSGFRVLLIMIVFTLALRTLYQPTFSTFNASYVAALRTPALDSTSTQAKPPQPNNTNSSISSNKNNALYSTFKARYATSLRTSVLVNSTLSMLQPNNTNNGISGNNASRNECAFAIASTFSLQPPTSTVVVTANLVPTFPATDILEDTLDSLSFIKGLEPNTPIIIAVDGINSKVDSHDNRKRLQDWVSNVRTMFKCHPNVQILASPEFLHIAKLLRMAFEQVFTEFVYVVEHDFPFIKEIDHELLIKSMHESKELRIVRFNKRWGTRLDIVKCSHTITVAGMNYTLVKWSNNNHFTTKKYYDWMLHEIGPVSKPPEFIMMTRQGRKNCTLYGQHLYGFKSDGPFLHHIDGKRAAYNRTHAYNNHQRCPNSTKQVPSSVLPWVRCPSWKWELAKPRNKASQRGLL
jgi:hypothetical protein